MSRAWQTLLIFSVADSRFSEIGNTPGPVDANVELGVVNSPAEKSFYSHVLLAPGVL
jgi:hypothetical protein